MVIGKKHISLSALEERCIFGIQTWEKILDRCAKVHKLSILIPLLTSISRIMESMESWNVSLNSPTIGRSKLNGSPYLSFLLRRNVTDFGEHMNTELTLWHGRKGSRAPHWVKETIQRPKLPHKGRTDMYSHVPGRGSLVPSQSNAQMLIRDANGEYTLPQLNAVPTFIIPHRRRDITQTPQATNCSRVRKTNGLLL